MAGLMEVGPQQHMEGQRLLVPAYTNKCDFSVCHILPWEYVGHAAAMTCRIAAF